MLGHVEPKSVRESGDETEGGQLVGWRLLQSLLDQALERYARGGVREHGLLALEALEEGLGAERAQARGGEIEGERCAIQRLHESTKGRARLKALARARGAGDQERLCLRGQQRHHIDRSLGGDAEAQSRGEYHTQSGLLEQGWDQLAKHVNVRLGAIDDQREVALTALESLPDGIPSRCWVSIDR